MFAYDASQYGYTRYDGKGLGWLEALTPVLTSLATAGIGVGQAAISGNIAKKAQTALINAQTNASIRLEEAKAKTAVATQPVWSNYLMIGGAAVVGLAAIYFVFRKKGNPMRRRRSSLRRRRR